MRPQVKPAVIQRLTPGVFTSHRLIVLLRFHLSATTQIFYKTPTKWILVFQVGALTGEEQLASFLLSFCRNLSGVSSFCQTAEHLCGSKRKSLLFDSGLRPNADSYH